MGVEAALQFGCHLVKSHHECQLVMEKSQNGGQKGLVNLSPIWKNISREWGSLKYFGNMQPSPTQGMEAVSEFGRMLGLDQLYLPSFPVIFSP